MLSAPGSFGVEENLEEEREHERDERGRAYVRSAVRAWFGSAQNRSRAAHDAGAMGLPGPDNRLAGLVVLEPTSFDGDRVRTPTVELGGRGQPRVQPTKLLDVLPEPFGVVRESFVRRVVVVRHEERAGKVDDTGDKQRDAEVGELHLF